MPHFHFCGNNRKIDDQGCTNVGIIKNFLSIQIQEQEQQERSMCFQTWSNHKMIAFISSCKKIAVKIRRKKKRNRWYLCRIFFFITYLVNSVNSISSVYRSAISISDGISIIYIFWTFDHFVEYTAWTMMDVQGDYQSSIVPANMRSNQGLFLTTNIPKRDLFCPFFLPIFTKIWGAIRL